MSLLFCYQLPLQIDIIRHPSECVGKSTASHAAVLAPDNVTVYTYPCIPNYDREKASLLKNISYVCFLFLISCLLGSAWAGSKPQL